MKAVRLMFPFGALILVAALAHAQGAPDFSKVEIKANKIADTFYTLEGQGGTIGVFVGPDGVFMVDTQFAPLSEKIAAAIGRITPQPIKFVVNTHLHDDHTGGDVHFGKMGATIISREDCASVWRIRTHGRTGRLAYRCLRPVSRSKPIARG